MADKPTKVTKPPVDADGEIVFVDMIRAEAQFEGGPLETVVHPDEVENHLNGGWLIKREESGDGDAS